MVIPPHYEPDLIAAVRHLTEAKGLVDMINRRIGESGGGKRERLVQKKPTDAAKRISSAHRELEKLFPRRSDWTLADDPYRPKRPRRRRAAEEPPEPPMPPPEDAS